MLDDKDLVVIALYVATIRAKHPELAELLEHSLYSVACDASYPESEIIFLLELTEPRILH